MVTKRKSSLISQNHNDTCNLYQHIGKLPYFGDLFDMFTEVLSTVTVEEMLQKTADIASRLIGTCFAVVIYKDELYYTRMKGRVSAANSIHKGPTALSFQDELFYTNIREEKQSVRLSKKAFRRLPSQWELPRRYPLLRGLLGVPLFTTDGDFHGAILVSNKANGEFTEEDEALLLRFAGIALQHVHTLLEADKRVTEAEQAAIEIEKNLTEYKELVEEANSLVIKMDRKGGVTFFNTYAQKFFGYTLDEILGKNVKILVPHVEEKSGRDLTKMVDNILRNPDYFEENVNESVLKNGNHVWISWRNKSVRDSEGNIVGTLAIGQEITKLKLAEDALRESEQRFRSLFENNLDGIMVTVIDGRVISANARMCEMLGMSEKEIIRAGRDGIVVQDENLEAALQKRLHTGKFRGDLTFRRKDGTLMPVEISASTFKDHDGTVKSGQVVRDITERKQMEDLLRHTHNELEMKVKQRTAEVKQQAELLNLAHDAIIVRDTVGKILFWSAGAEKTYGWTKAETKGKIAQELLLTIFPIPFQEIMKTIKREGRWEGELNQTCKEGKQIVVLSRWALRMKGVDGLPEILEVNSDISVRKEAEEAARRAGSYNRSLIEVSLDPLVTIGLEGKITDVNIATEEATGCSREELIGTDFSDYFTAPKRARAGYQLVFRKGFVRDYELEIKHKDGHTTPVFYNASVYKDESRNNVGVFAAARDITERKRTEEELLNKSKALEELNTALKVLLDHYKNNQKELEERVVSNIRLGVMPYIEKLKQTRLDVGQAALTEIIEKSLSDISSPFLKTISSEYFRFTPKEIEVIYWIKGGKTTKEIAQILSLSKRTIDAYRDNIRSKLGLSNKKANLITHLISLTTT